MGLTGKQGHVAGELPATHSASCSSQVRLVLHHLSRDHPKDPEEMRNDLSWGKTVWKNRDAPFKHGRLLGITGNETSPSADQGR